MAAPHACTWSGVFPAATTQFDPELQVDLPATQQRAESLASTTASMGWC